MLKDDQVYLGHMLDMAQKALEAASRVSKECRDAHPQIPWKAVVGMRHKVVHDYMDVNEDVVWGTVTRDLPPLIAELEKIVPPQE